MYAYGETESSVGYVFDVAHFSRFKTATMAIAGMLFAVLVGLGAIYFWNPDWILSDPSEVWADAHQEAKQLMRDHPLGTTVGVALASLFSLLCVACSVSCLLNTVSGDYYIRAGEGGLSLRVPDGFFGTLEKDFAWTDIAELKVVQEKRFGSLSRNAGNIGGELQLRTRLGSQHAIRLDQFREDAWLIYQRIEEARELKPAIMGV